MKKTFIEFADFTEWVKSYLTDEGLAAMQRELLVDPQRGEVIPGCGACESSGSAIRGEARGSEEASG